MANRSKQLKMGLLDGNLTTLSPKERGGLMRQFVDILSPPELEQLRDLAEEKRKEREEEAKALLAEFGYPLKAGHCYTTIVSGL